MRGPVACMRSKAFPIPSENSIKTRFAGRIDKGKKINAGFKQYIPIHGGQLTLLFSFCQHFFKFILIEDGNAEFPGLLQF